MILAVRKNNNLAVEMSFRRFKNVRFMIKVQNKGNGENELFFLINTMQWKKLIIVIFIKPCCFEIIEWQV